MCSEHYFYLGPPSRYAPKTDLETFPHLSYDERQDSMGYLPSCRPYSVTSPDMLCPVSQNYFWRTNPTFATSSMRERNKPWDTRHAIAMHGSNELMNERMDQEAAARAEGRKALRQQARDKKTVFSCTGRPHLLSYPRLEDRIHGSRASIGTTLAPVDPSWYVVRARTPEVNAASSSSSHRLPVDIINMSSSAGGRGSTTTSCSSSGIAVPPGSTYYSDRNYPEYFFESAPKLDEMIIKT